MTEPIDQATKVMSNTDGEDITRIRKDAILQYADNGPLVAGYIVGAISEYNKAKQELASLREQLKEKDAEIKVEIQINKELYSIIKQKEELILKQSESIDKAWGAFNLSEHKLKQKEDENRELINKIKWMLTVLKPFNDTEDFEMQEIESLISRLNAKLGK